MRWRAGRASEHCGAEGLGLGSGTWPLQGAAKAAPSKPQPKPTTKHTRWTLGEHDIDPGCAVLDGASVGCPGVCVLGCVAATMCIRSLAAFALAREVLTVCSDGTLGIRVLCWSACSCVRH